MPKFIGEIGVKRLWNKISDQFVQKEVGKGLSENNFSDEYKTELDNLISGTTENEVIERIKYYGNPDIIPSDESYFIVNETGETITGLTDVGKTQTELVIPYEIDGVKITTLYSGVDSGRPQSILNGSTTITKIIIPKSVTTLGRGVFYSCLSLTSINIPNSVTSISEGAFAYSSSLTSINIPNSITSIGSYTFESCTSLTSINIPNSIISIGDYAFKDCSSLKSINIPNSVTTIIGSSVFQNCTNLTIYCEDNSYAETYAKENNIPVIYTDVKADSLVNNILDDTGTGSIHQKFDGDGTFDFTGKNPNATALDSTLTGNINKGATGNYASSFGGKSAAIGKRSLAEGTTTIAKGNYSHAEGDNSVSLGNDSHAEGYMTVSHGDQSHSEGIRTVSSGASSHAEGIETTSTGRYSHSEGIQTKSIGESSHSEGNLTEATGAYSHVEGHKSKTLTSIPDSSGGDSGSGSGGSTDPNWKVDEHLGESSHAEGAENIAVGYASHAEGAANKAYGHYSHAEGILNITGLNTTNNQAIAPHAEGYKTEASGNYSHAEGSETKAQGIASHVEGSKNTSSGETSHAEGSNNIASGVDSHVEGSDNKASHKASHVEGQGNETSSNYQHIQGKYSNKYESSNYAHIVGNGESDTNRSNAYTLDWNGNGWFAGDIKVGGNQASEGSSVELTSNKTTSINPDTDITETTKYPNVSAIVELYTKLIGELNKKLNSDDAVGTKVANGGELFNMATTATGMYSHAENNGEATGFCAHAENTGRAEGVHSHAEGQGTVAKGDISHAQGYFTEARGNLENPQHVEGRWNIPDTENKYIHIAGNGHPSESTGYENSSNAHTLDWNGNAWFAGNVSIGTNNKLLETETNIQALAPIDNVITYTLSSTNHNTESRISSALETVTITISLSTDGYPNNYISSLVFTTAANSNITMAYTGSGALQWVGTDCDVQDGYSVFAPQSSKTYDIVFYFNGTKFIGLVNGYENVSANTGA